MVCIATSTNLGCSPRSALISRFWFLSHLAADCSLSKLLAEHARDWRCGAAIWSLSFQAQTMCCLRPFLVSSAPARSLTYTLGAGSALHTFSPCQYPPCPAALPRCSGTAYRRLARRLSWLGTPSQGSVRRTCAGQQALHRVQGYRAIQGYRCSGAVSGIAGH